MTTTIAEKMGIETGPTTLNPIAIEPETIGPGSNDDTVAADCAPENHRRWQLDIAQGLHQGASVVLEEGELLVIGSGAECDLQLFDEGVAAQHLALMKRQNRIVVKGLEGKVQLNGGEFGPGSQLDVLAENEIKLLPANVVIALHHGAREEVDPLGASDEAAGPVDRPKSSFWFIGGVGAVVFAILVTFLLPGIGDSVKGTSRNNEALQKRITEIMAAEAVATELKLSQTGGRWAITGILKSNQLEKLREKLAGESLPVLLRIQTAERLLEQVRDVFRINGYGAKVEYAGGGRVEVKNLDGDNPKIKQVAAFVHQDVPDLTALSFARSSPPPAAENADSRFVIDPGRRLSAIVDGDTAYVASQDGGRYFVGSLLPGGYTIREITVDGVQVDRDGEISWLRF